MSSQVTGFGSLPAPIEKALIEGMLAVPTPDYNYQIAAHKASMSFKSGRNALFLRPRRLQPTMTPVSSDGLLPPAQQLQRDMIEAQTSFYTIGVILNEQPIIQDQDPILSWGAERVGDAMKESEDLILREYLRSATGEYNCQGGSNGDNPTNPAVSDFANVNQQLDTANALKFVKGILGEDRFGTSPIRNGYLMLASTELQATLDQIPEFKNAWDYPSMVDVPEQEYGAILNMRIWTSSIAAKTPNASLLGRTIFDNITIGRQAYAHVDQNGYGMKLIYRPPEFSNYAATNATLAAKWVQAQAVLQETWITNFRCTQAA